MNEMSFNDIKMTIGKNCKIHNIIDVKTTKGNIVIGDNVTIEKGVIIDPCGGVVTIMDNVQIGVGTIIYGGGNVQIKADTIIGPRVMIMAQNPSYYKDTLIREQFSTCYGIWISEDCFIGAGAIILDSVNIPKGCIVGAGSVLTRSIGAAYEVWVGNPANFIKKREKKSDLPFTRQENFFPLTTPTGNVQKTPVKYPESIKERF